MKTQLNGRELWFDGESTAKSMQYLYNKILRGEDISEICVEEITSEIEFYNNNNTKPLRVKKEMAPLSVSWTIPEEYKQLPIRKFILKLLEKEVESNDFTDDEVDARIKRIDLELSLWTDRNMLDLLRTLIFIVDQFRQHNVVWGTGRGSSCCCYILYLIGLHDVDSVFYNLEITEFFRNE